MNDDPNKPQTEGIFKTSTKLLALRKRQGPGLPSPAAAGTQIQSQRIAEPAPRAQSEDKKPKFVVNPKSARQRDQSYDPSKETGMEEETDARRNKKAQLAKNNLLNGPKDKRTGKSMTGFNNIKTNTSNQRVAFGGEIGGSRISNYNKGSKIDKKIFDNEVEDVYKGKRYLFPIDVQIKTETEDKPKVDLIVENAGEQVKEHHPQKDKKIIDTLLNEFCFFQLPANLPLEGCAALTPKTEDSDMEINTEDLLSSFLNNRFDSTGYYLERDFKVINETSKEKMSEEKEKLEKKGKESKDKEKAASEKMYETFHIGKLCRMKNGEIKMKIGNNFFDVTEGVQDSFYKELFAIDYNDKVALSLFPIEKKFVIKPDMESFY